MNNETRFWGAHAIATVIMAICLIWIIALVAFGKSISLYEEKTALEIKVLQHELKAYEEMDKELAE